jgi:hypothetical protein
LTYKKTAASSAMSFKKGSYKKLLTVYISRFPYRNIEAVTFNRVENLGVNFWPMTDFFEFYEFTVTSSSFYRSQIRRIAAIAFEVASGRMGLSQVEEMFQNPKQGGWPDHIALAEPNGLYFVDAEYDEQFLTGATDQLDQLPVGPVPDPELNRYTKIEWDKMTEVVKMLYKPRLSSNPDSAADGISTTNEQSHDLL